jgi:predicted DNA-binding antitoxin AbrB/MazE fold protein
MTKIIEAVYEQGALRIEDTSGLKEHQRYRVIVEEIAEPPAPTDPALAAEIVRRTTVLPDGRRIVRLMGLFENRMPYVPEDEDPIADALEELRRERAAHFEAEMDEFFPSEPEP